MNLADYLAQIESEEFKALPTIIDLPPYLRRYVTADARNCLAAKFDLPNDPGMQDWEYEVADPDKIDLFLDSYLNDDLGDDEQFAIAEILIESFSSSGERFYESQRWETFLQTIEKNKAIHAHSIHYWSLDNYQAFSTEIEAYQLEAYFRVLWEEYKVDFIDKEKDESIRQYKLSLNYDEIKEQLTKVCAKEKGTTIFNHFNEQRSIAFHGSKELKERFLFEITAFKGSEHQSPVWEWIAANYDLKESPAYYKINVFTEKAAAILGIPQAVVRCIEELFVWLQKTIGNEIAVDKMRQLYEAIVLGKDLSLFIPRHHYWLAKCYLEPIFETIDHPILEEVSNYLNIIADVYQNYAAGKFLGIEDLEMIVALIRDWGYLINDKGIKMEEGNSPIPLILHRGLSVLNNISLCLNYGVNTADWAIEMTASNDKSSKKEALILIYRNVLQLLEDKNS